MRNERPHRASVLAALVVLAHLEVASAHDVSDELTVGALSSSLRKTAEPYVSDRLGGAADPSEKLMLSLDATYTRYFKGAGERPENIFLIAGAGDFSPDEHWTFGADVRGSPPSVATTTSATGTVRSRTSLVGGGVSAEYDTGDSKDLEAIADADLGVTSYMSTQRARNATAGTPSSLLQWRIALGSTAVLWRDSEVSLDGAWYAYSEDPTDTGYFGASVFGRDAVSDGIPLEPLRWSLRPGFRQHFGRVALGLTVQYGEYVSDLGWNLTARLKVQIKVSSDVRLWASASYQRDVESTGERLSIPWGTVGVRVYL